MLLLVAQLSPVMNSTTAYGFELVTISRRQKGSRDKVDVQAPKAVKCYNGNMGGVDELDGLRAGNYGCEGKGRALKWSNRLFDCMINVLFQTSYNVYRHCRRLKLENEEALSHGEFNERVIDHYVNNIHWRLEREEAALGRRASLREVAVKSNASHSVDINFAEHHDMEEINITYRGSKRIATFKCCMCRIQPVSPPITDKSRTKYYCVQCSVGHVAVKGTGNRVYLHPHDCFGKYHRLMFDRVVGSSNMVGVVVLLGERQLSG